MCRQLSTSDLLPARSGTDQASIGDEVPKGFSLNDAINIKTTVGEPVKINIVLRNDSINIYVAHLSHSIRISAVGHFLSSLTFPQP